MNRPRLDEGRSVEPTVEADRPAAQARQGEPGLDDLLAATTPENLPESFDDRPVGDEAL
jgi:hypothetical protein